MTDFQERIKLSADTGYSFSLLSELQESGLHTDIVLFSDGRSVAVHSAFMSNCSDLICNLLASTESNLIILPGFSTVLFDFMTLVYTGQAANMSFQDSKMLALLCSELGMTSTLTADKDNDQAIGLSNSQSLILETEMYSKSSDERFHLRLPISRINHGSEKELKSTHVFEGFRGRIQKEYNGSPVGPYEGPYDQDPKLPLYAQLSKSKLDYDKYTNFSHPENIHCKVFQIKEKPEDIEDLNRIELLEVEKDSTDIFVKPDDDRRVFYTCLKKSCMIPCPCRPCNSSEGQCPEHNIKHVDLFDENEHAISIRSTDLICSKESFFSVGRSYILKYPGIPKKCLRCKKDLLQHKSYHLDFHWNCKFCKLYQYKLYPKTIKELHEREIKEKTWYKSVCPHCDTKFSEPYQRKKHVELEHQNKKIKCEKCPKLFQCMQSLDYHKLTKHTEKVPLMHTCDICQHVFLATTT